MITSNRTLRGADRYITEILHYLQEIDTVNRYFIFYAKWQGFVRPLNAPNFVFIELSPPRKIFFKAFWQALVFPRIVKKYRLDLLHYTIPTPVLKKVCPLIVTIHDLAEFIVPEKYGKIKSWGKRFSVLLCVRRADFIIAVSESTKESIIKLLHYPPESIGVTIEGLHRPAEVGDCAYVHERYDLPAKYILYVGVIEKTKQVESIIKAFALLHESLRKEHAVIIVGEKGNAYGNVAATVHACNLDKNVRFLGYVPDGDLYCIYKRARAFVFPSRIEGFGLPVLEAMGYGTPVIASDIPAISEVTGDAAFLVNTSDIHALRDVIQKVLGNEALRIELGSKGMARSRLFPWYNTAEKTLAIYKKLVGIHD